MIEKIIDYVLSKISVDDILESDSTVSKYLKVGDKEIRISDHFSYNEQVDVSVIVPETPGIFIVSVGAKVYCYTSLQKLGDFLVTYIIIKQNTEGYYEHKYNNIKKAFDQYQESSTSKIKGLKSALDNNGLNKKIQDQAKEISNLRKVQDKQKKQLADKQADLNEAADLIQLLSENQEVREAIQDRQKNKIYYLDNFKEDAQDLLKEIIKDYY